MKQIKEGLNFYTPTTPENPNTLIDANTFFQKVDTISGNIDVLDKDQSLTKMTKLPKEELKTIIDKMLRVFAKKQGYDYFVNLLQKDSANFVKNITNDFIKFIKQLPNSKEEDEYYSKYGNNASFMKESDDKIWNDSMNDKEKQDWARVWLGLKPTASVTPGAAEKLFKFRRQMMREGKSDISEQDLANILESLGIKK